MTVVENEYRVIGPPGCGKTTYLSTQVTQRVERWCADTGLGPHQCQGVLVSSLTKAAAGEVLSRGLSLPDEQVGTLHAHALHALGNPKLCVGPKQISEWNKQAKMDHWIKGGSVNREEDGFSLDVGQFRGDELMNEYTINRCRMTPREQWRADVAEFADAFEKWKFMNSYMDYTDLIDAAFRQKVAPPGNPSTILVDECQDHDRLELRLLRYWATRVNKFIMVGDQDQAIFEWRGSDPGGFYDSEIPEGHTKVLEQSYRVPRAVHKTAMQMIERCGDGRKPVVYHPRDEEGEVTFAPYSLRMDPVEVVRDVERMLEEPDSKPGRAKVMILTTCAYMTQPITTALRDAGIPFWNPYSRERSNFNPLHPSKGMSTLDRILRYLKPNEEANGTGAKMWTWSDFHEWSEMCNADGWLRHGAKAELKRRATSSATQVMSVEDIESVLSSPDVLAELEKVDLGFLAPRITDAKLGVYNYVVDIQRKRGYNELSNNPRVITGTVHSVKGAEADHVILSPDLSSSGWEVYGSKHIDSLHRLFYVGLTRAYRRLVLCQASSPRAIQW